LTSLVTKFWALAPRVLAIEEKLRKGMGLRARQGDGKKSELIQACTLVNQVFESLSGTTVMFFSAVRENMITDAVGRMVLTKCSTVAEHPLAS
jgi:hypothetical protein